jgi:hypothetical protein
MKKLTLHLDDLAVESFETDRGDLRNGTVRGHESMQVTCDNYTNGNPTCGLNSCNGTCGDTDVGLCPGGSVGLSGCNCPTQGCTLDPHNFYCHDSVNYCDPTVQFTSCAENC